MIEVGDGVMTMQNPVDGRTMEFPHTLEATDANDDQLIGPFRAVILGVHIAPGLVAYGTTLDELGAAIRWVAARYMWSQMN